MQSNHRFPICTLEILKVVLSHESFSILRTISALLPMATRVPYSMVKFCKSSQMAIFKMGWTKYGAYSKTFCKKYPWLRLRRRPQEGGIFSKCVSKWTFGSSYFQNGHRASFLKFHNFVGDANYQHLATCPLGTHLAVAPRVAASWAPASRCFLRHIRLKCLGFSVFEHSI